MKLSIVIIGLLAVSQGAPAKDGTKSLKEALSHDAAAASVATVTPSGDLILFEGAITVPVRRPSVNECGVWMSMPPSERPKKMKALRREAKEKTAGMSKREQHVYVRKAMAPKRACQARFRKKCQEIRDRVPLETRKAAVADARKTIQGLLAEEKVKEQIEGYLDNVLKACPLEE